MAMKPTMHPLGLYIHVPFCKHKCAYCDFYSMAGTDQDMDRYTKAVDAHLKETAPFAKNHTVDTVYFGGGTPTLLGEKRLVQLLKTISKHYHLSRDVEITIEANPESAQDVRTLRKLRKAGCNRISLGMQSANDAELAAVGRIHSAHDVATAVAAIRKAGIANLSLDLIYGLPDQTQEQWQETLNVATSLAPEHLSCYGLKLEENTPLFQRQGELVLPSEDAQSDFYLYTVEFLAHLGYAQYEISNFAQKDRTSRHNMKYWTLGEYAGFGPSAHSDFGGVRYGYPRDLQAYVDGVLSGAPMVSESIPIPPQDRDTEWLMLGLRTVNGLQPKDYEARFRRRFDCFVPFLNQCKQADYAVEEDGTWHLTPKGFLVSNQIIGELLDIQAKDKESRLRDHHY